MCRWLKHAALQEVSLILPSFRDEWREGRSELALLAYAKLQLSFAAFTTAAGKAGWERGEKEK